MIRLMIADDHAIVREGLGRILQDCPDIELVAEVERGDEVVTAVAEGQIDVLLLDITMPGPSFLDLLGLLEASHPDTRILVFSMHSEDQYALRAFRAGAAGYLTKDRAPEEILEAIRTVHQGGRCVSREIEQRLAARPTRTGPPHETLSDREYEVMRLLGAGRSLKDIAAGLTLSPKTVSTYRSRVLEKMGFRSNADIVRYLLEHGISL